MSGQDFDGREIFIDTAQERTGGGGGGSFGGGGGFERPPRSECCCMPDSARTGCQLLACSWDARLWAIGNVCIDIRRVRLFRSVRKDRSIAGPLAICASTYAGFVIQFCEKGC